MLSDKIIDRIKVKNRTVTWIFFSLLISSCASVATSNHEWRSLFNGTDLKGWAHIGDGQFIVEDGLLKTNGGLGLLWYQEEKFSQSVISLEYKIPIGANSGIFIRIPDTPVDGSIAMQGYEVQIEANDDDYYASGALYSLTPVLARPEKANEWNMMQIWVCDDRTIVRINDDLVTDFTEGDPVPAKRKSYDPERGRRPAGGYIGLQNHPVGDPVFFRNIRVRSSKNTCG